MRLNIFVSKMPAPIFLLNLTLAIRCQVTTENSRGTCAVFLQNGKNSAFVIDSLLTVRVSDIAGDLQQEKN